MTTQLETKLMANDLFSSLQPEQEQEIDRIPEIKTNPNLEYLIEKYEKSMEKATDFNEARELYEKLTLDNKYLNSKNIEEFSLAIVNYQKLKNFRFSGYFISKAINNSKDENFTIHTKHLDSLISYIGYKNNGKTIIVNGNAGDWVGYEMINGIININGNAGLGIGWSMNGGSITVNGNAGDWVGLSMKNGNITVKGNAGNYIGYEMKSGIINLKGEYKSLSFIIKGGNIYHKGKLIVKNGEKIK